MSRIGKLPVSIPAGVTVTHKDNVVNVKGPKGELSQYVNPAIDVEIADGHVVLKENENAMLDNLKQRHAFHGLYRALIHNMVVGVSEGYKKELELVGVVRFVQKYVLSVSLNLTKEKVLSLLVKKFVESLVNQLALSNSHKIVQL